MGSPSNALSMWELAWWRGVQTFGPNDGVLHRWVMADPQSRSLELVQVLVVAVVVVIPAAVVTGPVLMSWRLRGLRRCVACLGTGDECSCCQGYGVAKLADQAAWQLTQDGL